MKNKVLFNYPIEEVLSTTLSLQTIQRTLEKEFKIRYFDFNSFIENKSLQNIKSWDKEKQNKFIKTIGGVKNFNKTKDFLKSKNLL
ncbi:MAG: hypothetical protein EBR82_53020 [Caulobacteraceae bacterium]|nr:hypothetical protein [Caulobacteraceae bacterium]